MELKDEVKRNVQKREGIALIEAALVLPLLMMLVLGGIQYGWCFLKLQQVQQAARHGVRTAVTQSATNVRVHDGIRVLMDAAGLSFATSGYTTSFQNATRGTAVTDVSNKAQIAAGELLGVTITIPDYAAVGVINAPLIPMPASITRSVVMAKEGPL